MSCDSCGTITKYGKKVPGGKRLCIDCWKSKPSADDEGHPTSDEDDSS